MHSAHVFCHYVPVWQIKHNHREYCFLFAFFWLRKLPEYYFFISFLNEKKQKKKKKNMNHGSPLFPTIENTV